MGIITKTTSFDLETIASGHLVILYDNQNIIIGSGVVIEVNPMVLSLALYTKSQEYNPSYEENILERVIAYRLEIEKIESGEVQLFLINPWLYDRGSPNAPVDM